MAEQFNGTVEMLAGEFKTLQELVQRELALRTYSGDATINAERKAFAISSFQATRGLVTRFHPSVNVWMQDAYKGNNNGVINQSAWAAGDFTAGGAESMDGGVDRPFHAPVDLASIVIYAPADCSIALDITLL